MRSFRRRKKNEGLSPLRGGDRVNCWRVQNLIAPFLDDELSPSESSSLAQHLEECSPCRELVESVAALPEFPRIQLDADAESALWSEFDRCLASRIAESLELPSRPSARSRRSPLQGDLRIPRSLAAAAAAVVVMLAGWNWMTYERLDRLEAH
jgi:anti-sigma factor RsiW